MAESMKLSEWIDKLAGIMVKMSYFNHLKLDERNKKHPNLRKLNEIQIKVDNLNEQRYAVWNEIEKIMIRVQQGKYKPQLEERTYGSK